MLRPLGFFLLSLMLITGCARNSCLGNSEACRNQRDTRIVFQFSVQGRLALNREDVTYYIVLNAPDDQKDVSLDPATQGPRINGTSLNDPPTFLNGRLPFTGLLPGDVESRWTDFYFLRGTADGRGAFGRGIRRADGTPEIVLQNYSEALWKKLSDSSVEIQIQLRDIFADPANIPRNVVVNLASSDSIDTGQGFLFDWWRSNIPFSIETAPRNTQIQDQDPNPQLIMRPVPGKFAPQLPNGVNPADVNILSYEYRVLQL
ncbi:MAG: hypothetical protein CVV27_01555 [Candidatus Melainabacteria bacterium HGW-Melainabacteria-1]|nr:MAG: hypothetical protein CVV27_01555 [Candidatus Melainabacteria bacterium HGW-Melainabacteria-1]